MNKERTTLYFPETEHESESPIEYVSSELQADALFHFVDNIDYIIGPLESRMLSPRYCIEPVGYLHINGIERIAFPMKCFCDINFHRIGTHLEWYGYYGLAFKKGWGLRKGIQPVQYINENSEQRKDFTEALNIAISTVGSGSESEKYLKNFILAQMLYYKRYDGVQFHKTNMADTKKCFSDECEWRYIPDVSKAGFTQVYYKSTFQTAALNHLSDAMDRNPDISLQFDYDDIKYIIIKDELDFNRILDMSAELDCDEKTKYRLISKVIIWENERRDF